MSLTKATLLENSGILRTRIIITALVVFCCGWGSAVATELNYLPMSLQYFMSRSQVEDHMVALTQYQIESNDEDTIDFVIPDPATDTKTAMFLRFHEDRLVGVTSGRYGMTKELYSKYMITLTDFASTWKNYGVQTIVESTANEMYIYKDDISYITISGAKYSNGYQATLSFDEIKFNDTK